MAKNIEKIESSQSWDCVFAMHLDTAREKEHVLVGERNQVRQYLLGNKNALLLAEATRPFGSFLLDCSAPLSNILADIRAILVDSTGRKKSAYFDRATESLETLRYSDNLTHRFVAVRIREEFGKACTNNKMDLYWMMAG